MIEIYGDMFDPSTYKNQHGEPLPLSPDAICITTNGFVKKNGEAVMGRGCAAQAKKMLVGVDKALGSAIKRAGNRVQHLCSYGDLTAGKIQLYSFPVKPVSEVCNGARSNVVKHMRHQFSTGQTVPGWACVADRQIIITSIRQLKNIADNQLWDTVILPRPGCGAGELDWGMVRHELHQRLDHRFYCITYKPDRS